MKKFVILLVMFAALQSNAQILVRSSTLVEGSVVSMDQNFNNPSFLDQSTIDQTIYWRKCYDRTNLEKTVYNFHSLYKRNSMIGARIYGIDFDLMAAPFDKKAANTFRYWNKLRMGFALIVEADPYAQQYPLEEVYRYLNGEMYISYLHLPQSARGDHTIKYRKGSFMFFGLITPSWLIDTYFKVKPIGNTWLKYYYRQEYHLQQAGICAEVEVNKHGYDHISVGSSKDFYHGFTFICGPEFNFETQKISLHLGIKLDLRNH